MNECAGNKILTSDMKPIPKSSLHLTYLLLYSSCFALCFRVIFYFMRHVTNDILLGGLVYADAPLSE